ncbi:MAG: dihydrolipoyl dehydrogenase [Candidatus Omnitrophota bacterium]
MNKYDLAVIGSGPAGYAAAIRAARLGMKVCVFEKDRLGGTCLNWGCIPTKAFSASAAALYNVERAAEFGINVKGYDIDFQKIHERKNNIVKKLAGSIEMFLKAKKIEVNKGPALLKDNTRVVCGEVEIEAKNILIAAGSSPFELPGMTFDGVSILSSTQMLELQKLPKSVLIVGGGVIGCEFASIFRTFGSEVTIVEMMDQLLPSEDPEIARKIEQIFKKRGIKVFTGTRAQEIKEKSEKTLVAVGRAPNSKGVGVEGLGIECDKGWIKVDERFSTSIKNIYAAGDTIGGVLLAHVASREGICAVEAMTGKEGVLNYDAVPNCIFTNPEIASVGLTERKARDRGLDAAARKFLFSAIGKSHVLGETDGFIKLVVENKTDKILGGQIIGPHATELIAELSLCVQFGITSEKLAGVIHAHPTLSEAIYEASEAVNNKAMHSL